MYNKHGITSDFIKDAMKSYKGEIKKLPPQETPVRISASPILIPVGDGRESDGWVAARREVYDADKFEDDSMDFYRLTVKDINIDEDKLSEDLEHGK